MDLIYMTNEKIDIGVIKDYTLDLAFGKNENNFECVLDLNNHCCEAGNFLYIENTEYGGIIDKIEVDTEKEEIIYSGRTWHGILEKKILQPETGNDYLIVSGEANTVLKQLINKISLSDLFAVVEKDSEIEIIDYRIRYENAYESINKMLSQFDGKLQITFKNKTVILSAEPRIDYSQNEEFDTSQIDFVVSKNYQPTNHLVCLGTGDLKERNVIHLFTDENGGLQPYTIKDNPVSDKDYILDTSKQLLYGKDEIAEIYDYPNAQSTENYILLNTQPTNWKANYQKYYTITEKEKYEELKSTTEEIYTLQKIMPYDWQINYKNYYKANNGDYESLENYAETIYTLQTSKPSDWMRKYENYYLKAGNTYKAVENQITESYTKQSQAPSDWEKNYENYYQYYSDGTYYEYKKVSGETKDRYNVQTMKPSDWKINYRNYYIKKKNKAGYQAIESNKVPEWKAKKYYTKTSYSVAPVWKKNNYYTYHKKDSPPTWTKSTYYTKSIQSVPTWTKSTYYTKTTEDFPPLWIPGAYYEKVIDNYAELVQGGIERLQESYNCDSISTTLDPEQTYDIGDIVGAIERITGIEVWQPITKKIVKIEYNNEQIEYEVGEI